MVICGVSTDRQYVVPTFGPVFLYMVPVNINLCIVSTGHRKCVVNVN